MPPPLKKEKKGGGEKLALLKKFRQPCPRLKNLKEYQF
jgi:hypothetical protein